MILLFSIVWGSWNILWRCIKSYWCFIGCVSFRCLICLWRFINIGCFIVLNLRRLYPNFMNVGWFWYFRILVVLLMLMMMVLIKVMMLVLVIIVINKIIIRIFNDDILYSNDALDLIIPYLHFEVFKFLTLFYWLITRFSLFYICSFKSNFKFTWLSNKFIGTMICLSNIVLDISVNTLL